MTTPTDPPSGARPLLAEDRAGLKKPIPATSEAVSKFLKDRRPVLWVGAGASVAAGYPGTGQLVRAMAEAAEDPIDTAKLSFFEVADAFVESQGAGDLGDLLQRLLGPPHDPAPLHDAIARLAKAGVFAAIVTTNYDNVLERALDEADVPYILQPLEQNAPVTTDGHVRILKLHGSREDWLRIILSGKSYKSFGRRYPFLVSQLDVLLRQNPVLFVGCSLQDPRILDWLAGLTPEAAEGLKPWRALMTQSAWDEAIEAKWDGGHPSGALARGNIRPFILRDHAHLGEILGAVAAELKPEMARLEIEIEVGDRWRAKMAGCREWEPPDLLADPNLEKELKLLRDLGLKALPTDERGILSPQAAGARTILSNLAASVGERLTSALLSDEARKRLVAAVHAGRAGTPPLLVLQVRAAADGEAAERRADRALALPWELLRLEERFPVEEGTLDLAREGLVDGLPGLAPPDKPLSIVATVASPVDASPFDHEEEMYRLWRAVGAKAEGEKRLLITDLGTLDDLAAAVASHHPPVIHFTGHGRPGELLFEDEEALSDPVPVTELIRRLRETGRLPRLVYLSACHGATAGEAPDPSRSGERMVEDAAVDPKSPSTAASLHRAGFPQVVAYFGPVQDRQATRAAAAFYAGLARGRTAWEALRTARRVSSEPLGDGDRATHIYPLGWAQLVLYHRGEEKETVLAPASAARAVDLQGEERKRLFDRIDKAGGSLRVEGIAGVQRLRFGFVGRRRERAEAIQRWRQGKRLLVVQGLGGLGKTTLCAEVAPLLARIQSPPARVLALDGRHAGAQADPVAALWQEVQAARSDPQWGQVLAELQKEGLSAEAVAKALLILSEIEGGLLVYLDDAESLQVPLGQGELGRWRDAGLARFWELLAGAAEEEGPFGVLASSRYQPAGLPADRVLPLPEMSRYEVIRLLAWMPVLGRMPAEDRDWVAGQVDGHPRTVEYLEALARLQEASLVPPGGHYAGGDWREEILAPILPRTEEKVGTDLLLGALWESLPASAQEHLGRCSVLTEPAPWGAILALESEGGTAKRLFELGLLSPYQPPFGDQSWWAPHRFVTEEAEARWSGDRKEAQRLLGGWFEKQFQGEGRVGWAMQTVHHLLAAEEADRAWPTALGLIIWLRGAGRYREALAWVERVLAAEPTRERLGKALALQVQLEIHVGLLNPNAEASLLRALELVEREDQSFVLDELGKLCRRQGQLRKAAEYLDRSVEVETAVKGKSHLDVAASLHALAGVLQAQGDLSGAREKLERSLAIQAQVLGTEAHQSVAASLHELAGVLQAQGNLSRAREKVERSLTILKQVHGTEVHPEVATSLHTLARVLKAQGDLSGAREKLERSLAIRAEVYGTREHYRTAITEESLGLLLLKQGEVERGMELLVHAYGVYQRQLGPEHPNTRDLAKFFAQLASGPAEEAP